MKRFWIWLRFGRLTFTPKSIDGGFVSEYEIRGRFGKVVGYWAYGFFDPAYPYQG